MSLSVTITGKYHNNKTNSIGLHSPKNCDMVDIELDPEELLVRAQKYFAKKRFKKFVLAVHASDSGGITIDHKFELFNLDVLDIFSIVLLANCLAKEIKENKESAISQYATEVQHA